MNASSQALIEEANRKSANVRKKIFANKANDQQHHLNLLKHVEVVMDIFHMETTLRNNNNFRAAMRELETAMSLSKRKLQP